MMYQPQKKVILARELKVGMIVVGWSIVLVLSITKEKITWLNEKGKIRSYENCPEQAFESSFARPAPGDNLLIIQP
jgi:hypothetical protein